MGNRVSASRDAPRLDVAEGTARWQGLNWHFRIVPKSKEGRHWAMATVSCGKKNRWRDLKIEWPQKLEDAVSEALALADAKRKGLTNA